MTTRDRTVLIAVAMLLVLGAFWVLGVSPRRGAASAVAGQVAAARTQRDGAVRQAALARAAQRRYDADYAAVARLGKAVPADEATAALLFGLQQAAGRSRVRLDSIAPAGANGAPAGDATAAGAAPTAVPGPAGATAMKLDLTFSGTYRDLQRFLARVQRFTTVRGDRVRVTGRLLSIDGFAFALQPATRTIKASVSATAYSLAAPAATPAAASAAGTPPPAAASAPATPPTASAAATPATVVGGR